jgi:hypothetical protein
MPSLYNHPPQESLVQHFPSAHFDDLEERVNQLMVARCCTNILYSQVHELFCKCEVEPTGNCIFESKFKSKLIKS